MTLNKMYHWAPRIISGLSQTSGSSLKSHDQEYRDREQQIGRKGRQELGDRLHLLGELGFRPTSTPIGTQTRDARATSIVDPKQSQAAIRTPRSSKSRQDNPVFHADIPNAANRQRRRSGRPEESAPTACRPGRDAPSHPSCKCQSRPSRATDAERQLAQRPPFRCRERVANRSTITLRTDCPTRLLEAKLLGPDHHWPKQQLVDAQDRQGHGRIAHPMAPQITLLDGHSHIGADPGPVTAQSRRKWPRRRRRRTSRPTWTSSCSTPGRAWRRDFQPPEPLPPRETKALAASSKSRGTCNDW